MDSHTLFAKTPPKRLFLKAAFPGSVSMLASALYQLIDGILVGRYLGATPFAALNLAMPFVIINFALADLIGVGSSVPISICLGEKREKEANNIFTCACLMIVGAGVLVGAALYGAAPALIAFMGAEGEFAQLAVQYLRIYALFSPLTTIIFAVDNYLRICGRIRYSMCLNLLMSGMVVAVEYGFLAVAGMGIQGAALAICLSMACCAGIGFVPFFLGKTQLKFCRPSFHMKMIGRIIACGSPNFLNNIAGRMTSIIMNLFLVRLGGEAAVSIYGILMYVEGCIQPLLYGMCDSLQPAVGYNWGAGQRERVRAIERCCFTASAILSLSAAAVIFLFPQPISRLFMWGAGEAFTLEAGGALRLFALTYITRWFSFAVQSYMLAVGNAVPAAVVSVSFAFLFPMLLLGILWPFGLTGLWMNFPGTSLLAAVLAGGVLIRFRKAECSLSEEALGDGTLSSEEAENS